MTTNKWFVVAAAISVATLVTAAWYVNVRQPPTAPATAPAATQPATPAGGGLSGSLLDQMGKPGSPREGALGTPQGVPTDQELEDSYAGVDTLQRQIDALQGEAAAANNAGNKELAAAKLEVVRGELPVLDEKLAALQGDLGKARAERPADPTLQWLSGELLMLVGGEPEEILPYFERAVKGGVRRPEALTGLARVRLEANQFEPAYQSALSALEVDGQNPAVWEMFAGVAMANGHFDQVLLRLDSAFPQEKPAWASALRLRARMLQDEWTNELEIRREEDAAGDLPRVRLTIEHQTFEKGPDGRSGTTTRATGRDEVELELFTHQAPATVANFLKLVERDFYNGTRFHWAEAASMVVGGDPNTRNADPADDGTGGPGYVIPDEFRRPGARLHFRGSVAMVESTAHTAGSQFFIELVPHPEMNQHLTVFGRVVKGQDGVDRITAGRTNQRFGRFGKAIPGDLLVRADVVRK